MMQKSVDEGSLRMSVCGMNNNAGGLVNDDDIFVLEKDIERYCLRLSRDCLRFGDGNINDIRAPDSLRWFWEYAVEPDATLVDELFQV